MNHVLDSAADYILPILMVLAVVGFIVLDAAEQGVAEQISWRSTWIRMLPNHTIITPKIVISESTIINYFYPSKALSGTFEVSVHDRANLKKAARVILEVAESDS